MNNTVTVSGFNTTKNRIMGRLSQCKDLESLHGQLTIEALAIERAQIHGEVADLQPVVNYPRRDMDALIGIDCGIQAANDALDGNTDKIDSL